MDGRRTLLRYVLLSLPLILVFTAIFTLVQAPLAWGAADHVNIPAWMPTFCAIVTGLLGLTIGVVLLREIRIRTDSSFSFSITFTSFGVVALLLAILLELSVAETVADSSTYDSFVDRDGSQRVTPEAFLIFFSLWLVLFGGFLGAWAYMYAATITPNRPSRFDRSADEVDAIGQMLPPAADGST